MENLIEKDVLEELFNSKGKLIVPNKFLAPYLQNHVDKRDMGEILREPTNTTVDRYVHMGITHSPIEAVEFESGIERKKLFTILRGEGYVLFDTADKLLTALDLTHLWYEDENLALIYRLIGVKNT